jgi:hypothetical protein
LNIQEEPEGKSPIRMYYIWGTRVLSGEYSSEFALYPFAGPWAAAGLYRAALEYNFPCRVLAGQPGNGRMGNQAALLDAGGEGVIASALYSKGGTALFGRSGEVRRDGPGGK